MALTQQVAIGRQQSAVALNPVDFDNAISTQGVVLEHWRSMRCPIGMTDLHDGRRPEGHDHALCNNGFIYTLAGRVRALFTGNSDSLKITDVGTLDGSVVQATFNRHYEDAPGCVGPELHVAVFDRFYLDDEKIVVPQWQTFESHISGRERLQYPAVAVQDLMDSDGRRYTEDVDFEVDDDGRVVWTGSERPGYDPGLQRGQSQPKTPAVSSP